MACALTDGPSLYDKYLIQPAEQIDIQVIRDEKANFDQIVATLVTVQDISTPREFAVLSQPLLNIRNTRQPAAKCNRLQKKRKHDEVIRVNL